MKILVCKKCEEPHKCCFKVKSVSVSQLSKGFCASLLAATSDKRRERQVMPKYPINYGLKSFLLTKPLQLLENELKLNIFSDHLDFL